MPGLLPPTRSNALPGLIYAWAGFGIMWLVWTAFIIFLAEPRQVLPHWPLPTVDGNANLPAWLSGVVDLALIALFGLQHSVMARPWFKERLMRWLPPAYERCTYVHMANVALLVLILFWQPIPTEVWNAGS